MNLTSTFAVSFAIITFCLQVRAAEPIRSAGLLVEEVLAQSEDPKGYDWRRVPLQIGFDYGLVYEANIFNSRSIGLTASHAFDRAWLLRGALRRVTTTETTSSRQMSQTIYSQAGQPSRFELLAGAGYILLDGRSSTPLSPKITDLGHALIATAGLQYNHFDSRELTPISGMRALYYDFVGEAGLRLEIYLPKSFGLSLEWAYILPLTGRDPELTQWQRFGGGLSWSFGR